MKKVNSLYKISLKLILIFRFTTVHSNDRHWLQRHSSGSSIRAHRHLLERSDSRGHVVVAQMAQSEHNMPHWGARTAGLGHKRERVQPFAGELERHERSERCGGRALARLVHLEEHGRASPRERQHVSDTVVATGHDQVRGAHLVEQDTALDEFVFRTGCVGRCSMSSQRELREDCACQHVYQRDQTIVGRCLRKLTSNLSINFSIFF